MTQREDRTADGSAKALLLLALPTFGQLIAEPIFVMIDTAIVGQVGGAALAGLSLGSTIILTAVGLCVFLAYSTTSRIARFMGAGETRAGLQTGVHGLWLSAAIGVALMLVLAIGAPVLCLALGGTGDSLQAGTIYTQTAAIGVPGMLLAYAANGVFRGMRKVSITFVIAAIGALLNTILDIWLVLVLGWGIAGSGIATCIAQWAMGLSLAIPALHWARRAGASMRPNLSGIKSAGGDGAPLFLRTLALRAGMVATVIAMAALGDDALAGYQIANATWGFTVNALDSLAIAGQTLVGAQIGAGNINAARQVTRTTARCATTAGIAIGALFVLAGIFTPGAFSPDADIQRLAGIGMVMLGIGLPLQGWMWALDGILIGAGDYRYLARTCMIASAAHIAMLLLIVLIAAPQVDASAAFVLIWLAFDFVLMGARGIANGMRIRSGEWTAQH